LFLFHIITMYHAFVVHDMCTRFVLYTYSITFTWIYHFLFILFVYIGVQHILYKCCEFFFLSWSCAHCMCRQFLWVVPFRLPFRYSLTFIYISKWCIFSVDFYDIHWLCNRLIHTIFMYFSWWQNYFQSKLVTLYSRI
jgi:hypothetical protein